MNRAQVEAKREMLLRELQPLKSVEFICTRCENFDPRTRICSVFEEVPPPEAVATDINCESWSFDEIPF